MTPLLRGVLHVSYGGQDGTDRPHVVYRAVGCGDSVTLTNVYDSNGDPALEELIHDAEDSSGHGAEIHELARRHRGKRGMVLELAAHCPVVLMRNGDLLTVDWDAIVAHQHVDSIAPARPRGNAATPRANDIVLIGQDARIVCLDSGFGWHPEMSDHVGRWMLVKEVGLISVTVQALLKFH